MITATAFAGKRYAVLGLARSGMAAVESLLAGGAEVTAWDSREEPRRALEGRGVELADPLGLDLTGFDGVVVSGLEGLVKPDPRIYQEALRRSGLPAAAQPITTTDDTLMTAGDLFGFHLKGTTGSQSTSVSAGPTEASVAFGLASGLVRSSAGERFEREAPTLSESQRQTRQKQLIDQNRDLERKRREFQEDLAARKNEELQQVLERANRVVRQVAEAEKYDLVIQEAVYINPKHDITDKVIRAINTTK